jgi:hypothetical protein
MNNQERRNPLPPDDDVPSWPEPDPLSSAQHRRWWRCESEVPASTPQH